MMKTYLKSVLLVPWLCLVSCGFWNPDPAERLAYSLERNAKELRKSGEERRAFEFVPDGDRAATSPRYRGDVVICVTPDDPKHPDDPSTIVVADWFWSSYHGRFVRVPERLQATKMPDEAFRIVLRKSGEAVV